MIRGCFLVCRMTEVSGNLLVYCTTSVISLELCIVLLFWAMSVVSLDVMVNATPDLPISGSRSVLDVVCTMREFTVGAEDDFAPAVSPGNDEDDVAGTPPDTNVRAPDLHYCCRIYCTTWCPLLLRQSQIYIGIVAGTLCDWCCCACRMMAVSCLLATQNLLSLLSNSTTAAHLHSPTAVLKASSFYNTSFLEALVPVA